MASGSGGDGGAGAASTGGGAQSARKEDHRKHATGKKKGNGAGPAAQGPGRTKEPVPFENTGGAAPAPAPGVWDLPMGGVVMALALCVMIGAAGGRVYAGIVAPPRR